MKYFSFFLVLFLFGCASEQVTFDSAKQEGTWEAKAQIRDQTSGKTNSVSMEVFAIREKALRLEITGTFGVSVASVLLQGEQISYLLPQQKKFVSGNASPRSLAQLLHSEVNPKWFYAVFFDQPIKDSGWSCKAAEDHLVQSCENTGLGTKVVWSERQGERKRITISQNSREIQILVKTFQPKVQEPGTVFQLEAPEGYSRYKLP